MKVLLTGASGRIGPHLVASFRKSYELRTLDRKPSAEPNSFLGDLADVEALRKAMCGVEVVVHLAATSEDAPFAENLVPNNVVGVYNLLEAARLEKVRRVIYASSVQAVGFNFREEKCFETEALPRPNTLYGATKVFGEILGRFYTDQHGLEFIALRIGAFQDYDSRYLFSKYNRLSWLSPRDAISIFHKAIDTPNIGYAIVHATSKTAKEVLSLASAESILGYTPQDDIAKLESKSKNQGQL